MSARCAGCAGDMLGPRECTLGASECEGCSSICGLGIGGAEIGPVRLESGSGGSCG